MYATKINGGSVENEFSVAANNKDGKREKYKRKNDSACPFRNDDEDF